jgi:hypothetical protein
VVAVRKRPSPEDRTAAIGIALSALAHGIERGDIARQLETLHPKNNTFPGEVLLELAADAIEESGASRQRPIEFEDIRERYLPESSAHSATQHRKSKFALRAAAMIRGGVDPGLLDEIVWWRTDDLWWWSLLALVIYVRAAAERTGDSVQAVCERIAERHGVALSAEAT